MLLDTSAWIELFQETDRTEMVKNVLETEENFTSAITFAEMVNWCFRNKKEDKITAYLKGIRHGSTILDLNEAIIISAGKLNYERKKVVKNWGMADSLILSTSLFYNLKILTKDNHFRDLGNVEML